MGVNAQGTPPANPNEVGNCSKTVPPPEILRQTYQTCLDMDKLYPTEGWKWSSGPAPSTPTTPSTSPPSTTTGACYNQTTGQKITNIPDEAKCLSLNPAPLVQNYKDCLATIGGTPDACRRVARLGSYWDANATPTPTTPAPSTSAPSAPSTGKQDVDNELLKRVDDACAFSWSGIVGCFLGIVYVVLVSLPSFLLGFVATFFDFMASMTLSGTLYQASFIPKMWGVIRDFGNIFFIIVLLYAAFQTILGLGHGGAKKVIASVIVMALMVNFSLFFTKVVIDSSNIFALIFYNKISTTEVANQQIGRQTGVDKKSIAAAFASNFKPNAFFQPSTFNELEDYAKRYGVAGGGINNYVLISMMTIYGIVTFVMCYALFIFGLSLLSRTLMLMTLMIVAPFAFVSFVIPSFRKIDTIGFDSWIHKLIQTSFVAVILMFILYLISEILAENLFGSARAGDGVLATLVLIFLPGILIAKLLLKGVEYAEKASGEFTQHVMKGAGVVGGLALGGAAVLSRGTIGRAGSAIANSGWASKWESRGFGGEYFRKGAAALGSGSLDIRGAKIAGQTLSTATGVAFGEAQKGGFTERRAAQVKKKQERAKSLEVGEDERLTQDLHKVERDLQDLLRANSHEIELIDKRITTARQNLTDANARFGGGSTQARAAGTILADLKGERSARKNGNTFTTSTGLTHNFSLNRVGGVATGASINDLEDDIIPHAHGAIETENRRRRWNYAATTEGRFGQAKDWLLSGGQNSYKGSREAAHKIRMEHKLDGGKKDH